MSGLFSTSLYRYTLKAVRRDRVIQLMLVMMLMAAAVSIFLGGAATIEPDKYAIAMAGTSLRTVAVLGLIIFISFFIRRAFDSREIDYLLATPLTRQRLLLSFSAAFITVAFFLAIVIGVFMMGLSLSLSKGLLVWCGSVIVELMVTSVMALFFSIVLKSATVSALCSLGFYSLSRMIGVMIGIIEAGLIDRNWGTTIMTPVVKVISVVVPRFDLLAQSAWIVYGDTPGVSLWIIPVQAIVFCALFLACAAFDLRRSQF